MIRFLFSYVVGQQGMNGEKLKSMQYIHQES